MSVSSIIGKLEDDPWREERGFSSDVELVHNEVFAPSMSDAELSLVLRSWLKANQPCLFGRMGSGEMDLISFCVLTERDLEASDRHIRDKIQSYRLHWKRNGLLGRKSAFIIWAISRRIANAAPGDTLKKLARRICSLYLREEILDDVVYHDRITLRIPGEQTSDGVDGYFEWRVGVNYFSSQGDQRWWHDHRIPGGMAFSMNSVGHMARSGALYNLRMESRATVEQGCPIRGRLPVDSLSIALRNAMLTIDGAANAVSGKATYLRRLDAMSYGALRPKCPIDPLPKRLEMMDYTGYQGWYDTDATIPADYFRTDARRPSHVQERPLDFRYLFDDEIDNPDFDTTGSGVRKL